jgi:Transglycosylase SLT domain
MADLWLYGALVLGGLVVGGGAAHPETVRTARGAVNTARDALPNAGRIPVRQPPTLNVPPSSPNSPKPTPISGAPLPVLPGKPVVTPPKPSGFYLPEPLARHREAIWKAASRNGLRPSLLVALSQVANPSADAGLVTSDAAFQRDVIEGKLRIPPRWTAAQLAAPLGLCQLRGVTFVLYRFAGDFYECFMASKNFEYAARHLASLVKKYAAKYGKNQAEYYALVAYHGGDGAVRASSFVGAFFDASQHFASEVIKKERSYPK